MSPRSRYGLQWEAWLCMISRSASVRVWAKFGRGAMRRKTKVGTRQTLRPWAPGSDLPSLRCLRSTHPPPGVPGLGARTRRPARWDDRDPRSSRRPSQEPLLPRHQPHERPVARTSDVARRLAHGAVSQAHLQPQTVRSPRPKVADSGRKESTRRGGAEVTEAQQQPTAISVMLIVPDAEAAVAWYKRALGAKELWNLGGVAGQARIDHDRL